MKGLVQRIPARKCLPQRVLGLPISATPYDKPHTQSRSLFQVILHSVKLTAPTIRGLDGAQSFSPDWIYSKMALYSEVLHSPLFAPSVGFCCCLVRWFGFWFFEIRFLSVIALAVLELAL